MQWSKPDFKEINLSGEVTAYVNTDETRWDSLANRQAAIEVAGKPVDETPDSIA